MSSAKSLFIFAAALLVLLCCASFNNPKALTAPVNQLAQGDSGQQMQALVSEVRQLRLAIQQSNFSAYHAQVYLERLRWQQPRVDRLNDKLEKVRAELADFRSRQANLAEEIKFFENELRKESDPGKRRELEQSLQVRKRLPEEIAQLEQQEAQLMAQLQPEQAKLNDITERLDAVQKDLEVVGKPQPSGKRQ
jgi:DNA repair exonuclease SbcCD ATPase subunit